MSQLHTVPQISIALNGAALSPNDLFTLVEVRVQQRLSLPALCELAFVNPTVAFIESSSFASGSSLRVSLPGVEAPLFNGQVTAIEQIYEPSRGREVRVRGYDLLHQLRKRQPVRAHVQLTLVDLFRELVGEFGLAVEAEESGPLWQRMIQFQQTDFDLLAELAGRCGLHFTLRENVLHVITLEGIGADLPLTLGETLLEARVEVNADRVCRSVLTAGWDPLRMEQHEGRAVTARVGRSVMAGVDPAEVGGTGERIITDETVQDDHQAEAVAQAELDSRVAQEVTLWGVAEGDPHLQPGARVKVHGIAPSLEGRYVLTAVDHIFDSIKGFISTISTAPLPPRPRARSAVAAPGVVTDVNDPEGYGRVRVELPTYNKVETDWLGVLTAGAGSGKGLLALPDVGDTVLVMFPQGEPAHGLILGGLYGVKTSSDWDWGIDSGSVRRYTFITPGGQRMQLDDAKQLIRLENSDGSYFELSPDKVSMHAQADLHIEAPGHSIVIQGQKIDFERG
jgi:phage baseplate assembly protein gpV/phage protein D